MTLIFGGGPGEPLPHSEAEYDAYQKRLPATKRDTPLEQGFVHHVIRAGQSKQEFVNAQRLAQQCQQQRDAEG